MSKFDDRVREAMHPEIVKVLELFQSQEEALDPLLPQILHYVADTKHEVRQLQDRLSDLLGPEEEEDDPEDEDQQEETDDPTSFDDASPNQKRRKWVRKFIDWIINTDMDGDGTSDIFDLTPLGGDPIVSDALKKLGDRVAETATSSEEALMRLAAAGVINLIRIIHNDQRYYSVMRTLRELIDQVKSQVDMAKSEQLDALSVVSSGLEQCCTSMQRAMADTQGKLETILQAVTDTITLLSNCCSDMGNKIEEVKGEITEAEDNILATVLSIP